MFLHLIKLFERDNSQSFDFWFYKNFIKIYLIKKQISFIHNL